MWRKIIDDYRLQYLNNLFEIKLIFYSLSRILQFIQFVWPLSFSVWDVFNNFFLIDATDRSKISSDQKRFFIALSLYPFSFFANTPFKKNYFPRWRQVNLIPVMRRSVLATKTVVTEVFASTLICKVEHKGTVLVF